MFSLQTMREIEIVAAYFSVKGSQVIDRSYTVLEGLADPISDVSHRIK